MGPGVGDYSLASTAPTARELSEHLQKALALGDNASPGERLMILVLQARNHGNPEATRQLAESLIRRRERAKSQELADQAKHMSILPTFSYGFSRARLAASTHSATSGSADGTPR